MNKEKILFIINPISGVNKIQKDKIEKLIDENLDKYKFDYEFKYTEKPNHATEISKQAVKNGFEIIVAIGGDGSINEVAKGIIGTETAMAIIPKGSGNGLAHHLNIPLNIKQAIKVINKEKIEKIDTVNINDDLFVSIAGVGFDALVAKKFEEYKKRGFKSYFKIILKEYLSYKPEQYKLIIDGKELITKALFISFANSSQFGYNACIAPNAKINDGLIDVCIIKKIPIAKAFILSNLLFLKKIDKSKYVKIIKAKQVKIFRNENNFINLDGEKIKLSKDLDIKISPSSLNLIVP